MPLLEWCWLLCLFICLNFYCYSITVVCIFSPSLHPPQPNPPPIPASTLPLDFVHVSFIVVPVILSHHCPSPPPLAIVRLFLTSMRLVIFCLLFFFCWLLLTFFIVPTASPLWYVSLQDKKE